MGAMDSAAIELVLCSTHDSSTIERTSYQYLRLPQGETLSMFVKHLLKRAQRYSKRVQRIACYSSIMACILSLFLHSCALSSQPQSLKIGLNSWPGYSIAYYAQSAGLFKQRGLDVELVQFSNQQDNIRATMRGALDASFVPLWEVMQVDPGEDRPAFVLVADISAGSDGIVARSGINKIADLRGKKVGVKLGTVTHLVLLEALKMANIPPEAVEIVDLSNEISCRRLQDGNLDAAVVWEPKLSQIAQHIKGKVLFTTADVESLVIDGLATRQHFLEKNQQLLRQFILAWFDAIHAVEAHPDKVFATIAKQVGQDAASLTADYGGLKKSDRAMNQQMFKQGQLQQSIQQIAQLLEADPRHNRIIRKDVVVSSAPVIKAVSAWKP